MITIDTQAIAQAVADLLNEEPESSQWLNTQEAADHLRVSPRWIRERVAGNRIPFHRLDGRVLFDRQEVDCWVREH